MGKITFLFLLFCTQAYAQEIDWSKLKTGSYISNAIQFGGYDCEQKEKFSEWMPVDSTSCDHVWVYAEWKDVNATSGITTLQYCPCGCGGTENQARICSLCLLHQKRVRTYWYEKVERKSDYKKLLEKSK